jgi:hypothetical protein
MFCFAMAGQSRRVMGPEGAIMRTDIALLAGTEIVDQMNSLTVMYGHVLSGGVDLEAFFYLRCKATSGKGAGVHSEREFMSVTSPAYGTGTHFSACPASCLLNSVNLVKISPHFA